MAQAAEASVSHLRTKAGEREIDLILEGADGRVLAIEVKLSGAVADADVRHLLWLRDKLPDKVVDLVVVNTGAAAYRRPDGVAVVPSVNRTDSAAILCSRVGASVPCFPVNVSGSWEHAFIAMDEAQEVGMAVSKTQRFHLLAGPDSLFDYAQLVLRNWTAGGLDVSQNHVQERIAEREMELSWFEEFDAADFQIVTIDLLEKQRNPGYMAVRRRIDEKRWLWIVLAHEVVITAWVRNNPKISKVSDGIVRQGSFYDAVAQRFRDKLQIEATQKVRDPKPLYLDVRPVPPGAAKLAEEPTPRARWILRAAAWVAKRLRLWRH